AAPTIGIGASPACDGQILVTHDMLGVFERTPKFVRQYAELATSIDDAAKRFAHDVKTRAFPSAKEMYRLKKSD
ncbi:MAG: 3-methyl-2-oxobutanoate hydroxymethyltransferase, partial [Pseudomonadota bacterium]